ncbi:related to glucan 1,3-beta-glucosidase [Rhynchosporium secalis]|uniref:Probable glucan endo-1,3-beta-glucosidase eglC n=1 Tax=Rhynchosporium secalis TaxID=38038 RepID=A0A1E1MWC8_RHYSE|nr:related to glucan 1,3-beta-glucosidase [Rhynchosporium secalis]
MRCTTSLLALTATLSGVSAAAYQGFNYGATKSDGYAPRVQSDFQALFQTAKNLVGTSAGFTSARLYTTIQAGTASDPTSAIPAAIAEDTSLLLGLWASGDAFPRELTALKAAVAQYGTAFTSRVAGISIGSEDLYRSSPTGIASGGGIGATPETLVNYIGQVRAAIAGTPLSAAPIGHVDTWNDWVNGSNKAVADACDWIGVDAYPYFESTKANGIENGAALFNAALAATAAAVGNKPLWITETGWPTSGKLSGQAVGSTDNAKTYWQQVGCPRFGVVNTWWYTLEDTDNNASPNPSFGIAPGSPLSSTPLFDLSCNGVSSSSATPSSTASGSAASASASSVLASASSDIAGGFVTSGGALSPSKPAGYDGNIVAVTSTGAAGSSPTGVAGSYPIGTGVAGSSPSGTQGSSPVGTGVLGGSPIGGGSGSGSGSGNGTLLTTPTPTGAGSGAPASTSPAVETGNGASMISSSVVGAMGAMLAAFALL